MTDPKRAPTPEELRRIVWRLNSEHPVDYGPDDAITQAIIALESAADALAEREWREIDDSAKDGSELAIFGSCRPSGSPAGYARDANIGWWSDGEWHTRIAGERCDATHYIRLPSPPPAKEGKKT